MRVRVSKRQEPLGWGACLIFLGALAFSLAVSAALLGLQGKPPVAGIRLLFEGAFGSRWALEDCLLKAVPIFLCALGVAVAFRLQIWNLGAEGQFALGAIGASWAALAFPALPGRYLLPLMFLAAAVAGGLWGLVPAILKLGLRVNEIIVTLMLNYIGILILEYKVYGAWKDPGSFGFPMTPEFPAGAIVGSIGTTRLNWGLLVCLASGAAIALFLGSTRLGYELKACGENIRAARYARLPYGRLVLLVMALSGALAGWAGCLEASGSLHRLQPTIMAGYGYTAIVVAWLARLNPLNIGIAALLLAGLRVGVENLQLDLQVPAAFGQIMEGLILLTVLAGNFFRDYRLGWRGPDDH